MQARRERRQHQRVANHATPSITISKAHFILVIHSQLIHENSDLIFLDRGNENSDLHGGFFPLQLPVACTIPWAASISTSKGVDGCTQICKRLATLHPPPPLRVASFLLPLDKMSQALMIMRLQTNLIWQQHLCHGCMDKPLFCGCPFLL
jgi:hypothetical protein